MQEDFATKLLMALSDERIGAYRDRMSEDSNANLFAHYAWNIALSESLYPSLQILEVVLRNRIHQTACYHFGKPHWYEDDTIINIKDRDSVSKAKKTLAMMNKPIESGRIIAELNFGFWTALMDRRYEQVLWPRLLKPCFPNMARHIRTRKNISGRFERIRRLRNRIFHHEPIWYWHDLEKQHQDILEAIAWIEPAARDFVTAIDKFPDVYQNGLATITSELQRFC